MHITSRNIGPPLHILGKLSPVFSRGQRQCSRVTLCGPPCRKQCYGTVPSVCLSVWFGPITPERKLIGNILLLARNWQFPDSLRSRSHALSHSVLGSATHYYWQEGCSEDVGWQTVLMIWLWDFSRAQQNSCLGFPKCIKARAYC